MDERQNALAGPSKPKNGTRRFADGKKNSKKRNSSKLRFSKAALEARDIESLNTHALQFEPPTDLSDFSDLPISSNTKKGLKKAFFIKMTDIQVRSIPLSLKGKDVLGAARTGSGKTLAFLVPVLECLYRKKWGPQDGLGALIISPTRELAVQIFDVLRAIGGYHSFSAGLIIGGKSLKDERERLDRMNILVATPGRLLQHMDQTFGFDSDNLQMLVLDEADRILDMGFARTLNALLDHLPKSRQTLLFSATQNESVQGLARLSLKDPVYVGVKEEGSETATPKSLEQYYVVCELDKKLDVLWSFIKSHLQSKILVFMSSGKQVRFVFETFCKLQPGISLLHLHGKQKQTARLATCSRFTSTKHAVLIATDLAARGLDFPAVDWVLQVDAPEDAATYIHRVGRTARYESSGKALLLSCPSEEEGILAALKTKDIQIEKIKIKESKTQNIEKHLQNLAFQDPEIKYLGQRAFISYMRSVFLHKDKSIFQVDKLPADRFAASLGLPGTPKIKFLAKAAANKNKNAPYPLQESLNGSTIVQNGKASDEEEEASSDEPDEAMVNEPVKEDVTDTQAQEDRHTAKLNTVRTKYDRMFGRKNQNILSEHYTKLIDHSEENIESDGDEDFITLKRADHELPSALPTSTTLSKRKSKMGQSKKAMLKYHGLGEKLTFDEEGKPHKVYEMRDVEEEFEGKDVLRVAEQFAEGERGKLKEVDAVDKQEAREKKREKKRKRKEKDKTEKMIDSEQGVRFSPEHYDDGYQSPTFSFISEAEDADLAPPSKKHKLDSSHDQSKSDGASLQDVEELALRLLHR